MKTTTALVQEKKLFCFEPTEKLLGFYKVVLADIINKY